MTPERDLERSVRAWLADGPSRLPEHYLNAALDKISTTHQRRRVLPVWRPFEMNTRLRYGLVAAAIVIATLLGIYLIGSGRGATNVTPTPSPNSATPLPTPVTLNRIAFIAPGRDKEEEEIFVMNADGSGRTQLTNVAALDALHPPFEAFPAWSPDGRKIAFVSGRDTNDHWNLYIMDADGSKQTRITTSTDTAYGPAFSPDSHTIVFLGGNGIWVVNVDGSGLKRLTNNPSDDHPVYSPDGRRIAFVRLNAQRRIFVLNADGSAPRQLTNAAADDDSPAWSPDGNTIAFHRTGSDGISQVYLLDVALASTNPGPTAETQLTREPSGAGAPAWSPDGMRIAFVRALNIWDMNADGSGQVNLTNDGGDEWYPAWR